MSGRKIPDVTWFDNVKGRGCQANCGALFFHEGCARLPSLTDFFAHGVIAMGMGNVYGLLPKSFNIFLYSEKFFPLIPLYVQKRCVKRKNHTSFNLFLSISKRATESTDLIIAVGMNSTKHDITAASNVRSVFM